MTEEELLQVIEQAATESVTELDLCSNQLTALPPEIGQLTNLEFLYLSDNKLSSLPSEIGQLTNLQTLHLSNNKLSSLPNEIGQLTNLQTLHLYMNQLSSLPSEIGQLTNLEILYLYNNQLSSLPSEIGQLTNLQMLHLYMNQLSSFPIEIGNLSNLQMLNIERNKLSSFPIEIGNLSNLQMLNIERNKLSSFPIEIGQLTNLQTLNLEYNELRSLPSEIGQLTNLETLNLEYNQLSSFPIEIGQLTNLETLNLEYNQLSSFPIEIGQLTNLQKLDLNNNKLSSLPSEIGQLTNLQKLDLNNNQLSSFPIEIGQLTNLQKLDLNNNKLSSLPSEIGQLTNLQKLDLNNNQLSSFPIEIGQLTNLQKLDLNNNKLSSLPSEIGQLTNLQTLDLNKNQLSSLPSEIGQLTNLQKLDLNKNQLSSLPSEIGQLTNLQTLDLNKNQLSSLPSEIGQLTNLQTLHLDSNQLSSLPSEIGQLTNLQTLHLDSNQLSSLPSEIGQLTNLQTLHLDSNQLSSLPSEIGQLTNLQILDLNNNQRSSLPSEIGQILNLQKLFIENTQQRNNTTFLRKNWKNTNFSNSIFDGNKISILPREIGQLTNLKRLLIEGNQLSSLPSEIKQLRNLKILRLQQNPLPIPPEILELNDVNEIIDFYFRVQDPAETEPFYEAKFLIIGEGGAGKTSLAKKIENENYELQSDEESTQGIDVIQWHFTQPNGKEFRVNIWDFGGQEIYHQTHQFFLTERSLYALVIDTRQENTDFYWWLKVVELLSDNSPVIIIKNEKQGRQCEVNERQLRGEFTNLKEVLVTNLADNRGLAEIKDTIQLYMSKLTHIGTPLPKLWVKVRVAIENYPRNYISLEEYCRLCRVNNLTDPQDMLRLSRYLHDLGVCLHFQDDPTLKHYVILKPEWGTVAVYKVLDNSTVKKNLGCFTKENLKDIWQEVEYAEMRDELLQLMMRFKLCYPIPNRHDHYIAPQLLDLNQPEYSWETSNNLILRYKYEFMPKGVLTRFIVETHPWVEQQKLVWRTGVVLNKDQTRAEIIEQYNQKEIKIRVTGNRKKELLAVVTHELEKIHQSFERLQYHTLVPCNCKKCEGSPKPYSYPLENLHKRLKAGRYQIECDNSYEMVDVRKLIDDVNLQPLGAEQELNPGSVILQQELSKDRDKSFKNQTIMNYHDFQILVTEDSTIRASSEQGEESGKLQLDRNAIELALGLMESRQTNAKLLKGVGSQLYQALFPTKIHGQLRATIAGAQADGYEVRLRLVFKSAELAALPWEFLYDEATNTFLANNTQTVLSRYIDVPLQKRDLKAASLPLKILLVISSPTNLPQLDVLEEERLIREALAKHIDAGQIELDVLQEATIRNINQKLREKPYNVFHFIGHGVFENHKGSIALVDTDGKNKLLNEEDFANFFLGNRSLGLAVLNSCQGAAVSSQQVFAGIAPNLVRRGIPAVVAMQYSILDTTAKLFADEFYRTLALGWPVDAAIQTTRNAISIEVGVEKPDFGTPVLYMRAKDGIILSGL
ncbi:leucine-rich repeat domain-containing protein [Nostoc muscorum FACHB-395]|nr:leucine-rich repeat domain-containing protein [Desmonostoc muscorum FACHB-395]